MQFIYNVDDKNDCIENSKRVSVFWDADKWDEDESAELGKLKGGM